MRRFYEQSLWIPQKFWLTNLDLHHGLLAVPGGREVVAISFWEQKENAQAYNSTGYPEVLKILEKFLDGTPHVRTFDVVSSTVQKVATPMAA
jgi:hypothetical protein